MRRPLYYNISYNGKILYKEVSEEECTNLLAMLAEKSADGIINSDLIEVEAI